jgi:hypothetical protein
MLTMREHGLWGRGTQRGEKAQREDIRKEREASPREEETLRNDQCQAKGSSEGNHNNTINTVKSNPKKRAAVCSDANHIARGNKKSHREAITGEEAGVRNPKGITVAQKADKDDGDQQGFNGSLFQPCSKEEAAVDARIHQLEQELHILEQELKNENQLLWGEAEKMYADAVHTPTREATARASGMYRAR